MNLRYVAKTLYHEQRGAVVGRSEKSITTTSLNILVGRVPRKTRKYTYGEPGM